MCSRVHMADKPNLYSFHQQMIEGQHLYNVLTLPWGIHRRFLQFPKQRLKTKDCQMRNACGKIVGDSGFVGS